MTPAVQPPATVTVPELDADVPRGTTPPTAAPNLAEVADAEVVRVCGPHPGHGWDGARYWWCERDVRQALGADW